MAMARESNVLEFGFRRFVVTLAIIMATVLEIIDVTIVNVALPNIQGGFGASVQQAAWIGTGYIIANVVVIPITPWLQRRFGRKQYYFASIAIFTFASAMCGLANSIETLVFWRIIQGLGGGGLISTSQAILRETYPLKEQGKASGIFAMGVIVGPTIGPYLGGMITDNFSWRWAFYVNIPLGILAMVLVWLYLRNPEAPKKLSLDAIGLALLAVGIGSMQYVLDQGQELDWFGDGSIRIGTVLAVVGLIAFVIWELRFTSRPIVDLRILKYRSVAVGSLLAMVLGISLYGSVLVLPLFVQTSLGFTATMSGEVLMMRAVAVMLLTPISAALAARGVIDARIAVGIGFVAIGISNFLLAQITTTDASFWSFFLPLFVSGIGLSQIFVPLTISVLSSVKPADVPNASAFFNLSRQVGGSIAIAILVTMIGRQAASYQTRLSANATLASHPVAKYLSDRGGPSDRRAVASLSAIIGGQAVVLAYGDTARVVGWTSLLLAPLVLLMRKPRAVSGMPAE